MAPKYTPRMDTSVSPIELFIAQIPGLVSGFIQAADRKAEREEDRLYRDAVRREEVETRDRWREEDLQRSKLENKENNWLKLNSKIHSDFVGIYNNKVEEYETLIANYEKTAGKVDKALQLDQTTEWSEMWAIQTENAVDELAGDITTIQGLIKKQSDMVVKIKGRLDFFDEIGFEFSKRLDIQNTVIGDTKTGLVTNADGTTTILKGSDEETETGLGLFTDADFKVILNDIVTDPIFKERNKFHLQQDYAKNFIEKESSPSHQELRKLNDDIYAHEIKKFNYNQGKKQNEIENLAHTLSTSNQMIHAKYIQSQAELLTNLDEALIGIPGFLPSWTRSLGHVKVYNTDYAAIPNWISSTESIDMIRDEAVSVGWVPKDKKHAFTRDHAVKYLEWKAMTKLSRSSGIIMLAGPDLIKNAYISETKTYTSYMKAAVVATTELDNYIAAQENKENDKVLQMEMMWARRLGLDKNPDNQQIVNHKKFGQLPKWQLMVKMQIENAAQDIGQLIGNEDVDMKDTAFIRSYNEGQQGEQKLSILMSMDPQTFIETKEQIDNNTSGLFNNDMDFKTSVNTMTCGPGEFWDSAIQMCLGDDQNVELSGISLQRQKHNEEVMKSQLPGQFTVDINTGEVSKKFESRGGGRNY
jgi:hypothetical protein